MIYISNLDHSALGNRLTILISDLYLCEEFYKADEFQIYWENIKTSFNKLFTNNFKIHNSYESFKNLSEKYIFHHRKDKINEYTKGLNGFVYLNKEKELLKNVYSYYYKFDHTLSYTYERTPKIFIDRFIKQIKKLKINKNLLKKVDQISDEWKNKNTVGVHIRLGDFNKYEDRKIDIKEFYNKMDELLKKDKSLSFYISTDENRIIPELQKKYGKDKIYFHDHQYDKNRSDYETSFIGILLLAKCKTLILTNYSTYSQLAWYFGMCKAKVHIIQNPKQIRSYNLYSLNNNFYDEIVSLGSHCKTSQVLKQYEIKGYTYIFDWLWSSISFITKFFKDKEFEYCDVSKLNFVWNDKTTFTYIFNNGCKGEENNRICTAVSVHDATNFTKDNIEKEIPNINERYNRRYNRLIELLNSEKSVLFVRFVKPLTQGAIENSQETVEDYIELHNIIKNNYNINFKIIIIDQEKIIDQNKIKGFDNIIYTRGFSFLKNIIKY